MFGQLPGRSVFNTPTGLAMFVPFSVYYLKTSSVCLHNPLLGATPSLRIPPFFVAEEATMLAARVLAIVHAWSAWRAALQRCVPHRRQRSSSPACSLLRLLQSACSRRSLLCRRLSPPARCDACG